MYKINETSLDYIKDEFKEELNDRDYNYRNSAINFIFDTYQRRKANLLELFSKHPNWNPEHLMISFDEDFSRKINTSVTGGFFEWLFYRMDEHFPDTAQLYKDNYSSMYTCFSYKPYLEESDDFYLKYINAMHESFRFRAGMKVTKCVKKICSTFGWDKIMGNEYDREGKLVEVNLFEREFAKFCDAVSPIKITRHTCISLNPVDFLLMSNGNSWDSCHYIGDEPADAGCYSSGTISYMLDEHSFIFYTVSSEFTGEDIERERKINRQVFGYNDYQLLQSRLYPQGCDVGANEIYTDIRNVVQKVIADCLGEPNLWIKRKVNNVYRGDCATVYEDWYHFSNLCSVSILKGKEDEDLETIYMGAEPICINCGEYHTVEGNIDCEYDEDEYNYCEDCGCRIHSDNTYWVGDYAYCHDCVTYCERCGEYEVNDNTYWIESEQRYVCESCYDDYYGHCDCCNDIFSQDELTEVSGNQWVCSECLREEYTECAGCGDIVYNDEVREVVNHRTGEVTYYCEDCYEEEEDEDEVC